MTSDYITAKEAASAWGISQRRVSVLCSEQRISGATRLGNMWIIPKSAEKPIDARSLRYSDSKKLKPFLKWAGGKGQIVDEIRRKYPAELGTSIKKYAEPFVGGGAVLFDILNNYDLDEVYISDTNAELINTYACIKNDIDSLVNVLSKFQDTYLPMNDDERKTFYYAKRDRFNELKADNIHDTELAALFIFLNRTCFNGLYRVNRHGAFNVPMGSYKSPTICDENNLRNVSEALTDVTIICGDYHESEDFIDSSTFVYFDPPYRPLTETASFTSYTENEFDDAAQRRLAAYIIHLSEAGTHVLASNSDPKNTNPDDEFFDDLYSELNINRISASRMINSNASKRGKISELLICNY